MDQMRSVKPLKALYTLLHTTMASVAAFSGQPTVVQQQHAPAISAVKSITKAAQTTDVPDGVFDRGEGPYDTTELHTPLLWTEVGSSVSVPEDKSIVILADQTTTEAPQATVISSEVLDDDGRPPKRRCGPDSPKRPFACSLCLKSFTRRATLNNHQRQHTGERPFRCRFCGESFAQNNDKKRHERSHGGEKAFQCGGTRSDGSSWGCGKAFARKDGLLEHHQKTVKGGQCLARRDEMLELGKDG